MREKKEEVHQRVVNVRADGLSHVFLLPSPKRKRKQGKGEGKIERHLANARKRLLEFMVRVGDA